MTSESRQLATRGWTSAFEALGRTPAGRRIAREPVREPPMRHGFRAGTVGVLIESGKTGEVLENPDVHRLPNTADWLVGLVNLRGNLVPIFDLEQLLDGGEASGTCTRLLVIGGAEPVGFPIEALPEPVRIAEPLDRIPALTERLRDHVRAAHLTGGQLWLDIDIDTLLLAMAGEISR